MQIGYANRLELSERNELMSRDEKLKSLEELFGGRHFGQETIILCVRWYLRYKLSLRDLVEMMAERGVEVDHSTVHGWVIRLVPSLKRRFADTSALWGKAGGWTRPTSRSKANRAVHREGNAVDFLLRARRDKAAARSYFEKAIGQNGEPETITVDKSGANLAALKALNAGRPTSIKVRQNKYLNNIVEQDHRTIKRIIKPMMGFKGFRCARIILVALK